VEASIQQLREASDVVHMDDTSIPPVNTDESLEQIYEKWSETKFDRSVIEIARGAIEGSITSEQLLDRVCGYLALVALESETNPPGEAYARAGQAVIEKIGQVALDTEDNAVDEIIEIATQGANSKTEPAEATEEAIEIPTPELEGVSARVAVVNYLSSLPDRLLETSTNRSVINDLANVLNNYGHTTHAIRQAISKLTADGMLAQTKFSENSSISKSLQASEDAKDRVLKQKRSSLDKRNDINGKHEFEFLYEDSEGRKIFVDLTESKFLELPAQERFLVVAARFHNVRFIGVSVFEKILRVAGIKDAEGVEDIEGENLVSIDEHNIKLTKQGEERLRVIKNVTTMPTQSKNPIKVAPENSGGTANDAEEKVDSRRDPEVAALLKDFKEYMKQRGAGITPEPDESVTKQFIEICCGELGATLDVAKKLSLSIKNDPGITKVSFKLGKKHELQYLGLQELQDDPLTRSQIMANDLRIMLDGYASTLLGRNYHMDPNIESFRNLCDLMTQKEWTEHPYRELEQYSAQLLVALRYVAQSRRMLNRPKH
jgi:hypothetical protein